MMGRMQRPTWVTRRLLVVAAVVVLALGVVLAVVVSNGGRTGSPQTHVASDVRAKIPAAGGVTLSAEVISPSGSGPFPLIVMPASYGSGANEYRIVGRQFASAGYQVVSYAQRGFKGSGGTIDLAGAATREDVSTVIDWALGHTRADRTRIGALGISYGAGISLLAAAHDKRIRVVVAMSGWADLAGAFVPQGTPNVQGLQSVIDVSRTGVLNDDMHTLADDLESHPDHVTALVEQMSRSRSAADEIRALNQNQPAIMLASAYADSVIDPTQLVSFFNRLHTPKRLQLSPGEHTGPELNGLFGKPDPTFMSAAQWLEHYLRGKDNGIDRDGPVLLQDGATGTWHTYPAWPAAYRTVQLATPGTPGNVVASDPAPWTRQLSTGTDSGATSGRSFTKAPLQYRATTVDISSVRPADAYVWTAAPVANPVLVSGTPKLRFTIASSSPSTTLYAYLYDVDESGSATLMTYAPATASGGAVTMTLRPVSWSVVAGHHVALVVDTVDARYASAAPSASTVTLSSPASLSVPFG
jgi:putative CocE/NonD family hydrolase